MCDSGRLGVAWFCVPGTKGVFLASLPCTLVSGVVILSMTFPGSRIEEIECRDKITVENKVAVNGESFEPQRLLLTTTSTTNKVNVITITLILAAHITRQHPWLLE